MKLRVFLSILLAVLLLINPADSFASKRKKIYDNSPFSPNKYAALVVDSNTGTILHKANADKIRYPASLTKLMTLYLTFDALQRHKLRYDDYLTASKHAALQPKMGLGLKAGSRISVKNLISSLVVVSANDSAVVLAEKIAGSEKNFAKMMNQKAKQIGMKDTNFVNASGLHNPKQITTAIDMAKLMLAIKRDFPGYYGLLSQNQFAYKGTPYKAHSKLMTQYSGFVAGKTGYVKQSGFNLVMNAEKDDKDLIAVVMGGRTAKIRDDYMENLLDKNFLIANKTKPHNMLASR